MYLLYSPSHTSAKEIKSIFYLNIKLQTLVMVFLIFNLFPLYAAQQVMGPTGIKGTLDKGRKKIIVNYVDKGSPASKAGIKAKDVIVGIGKGKFTSNARVAIAIAADEAEGKNGKLSLLLQGRHFAQWR